MTLLLHKARVRFAKKLVFPDLGPNQSNDTPVLSFDPIASIFGMNLTYPYVKVRFRSWRPEWKLTNDHRPTPWQTLTDFPNKNSAYGNHFRHPV